MLPRHLWHSSALFCCQRSPKLLTFIPPIILWSYDDGPGDILTSCSQVICGVLLPCFAAQGLQNCLHLFHHLFFRFRMIVLVISLCHVTTSFMAFFRPTLLPKVSKIDRQLYVGLRMSLHNLVISVTNSLSNLRRLPLIS